MADLLALLNRFENAAGVYERSDDPADRDELHAARRAILEAFEALTSERNDYQARVIPAETEVVRLEASLSALVEREAELVKAAQAVLDSWGSRLGSGEVEERKTYRDGDISFDYWSPASSMVDSEAIANLRTALHPKPKSAE